MPVTASLALGGLQTASGIAQYFKGRKMAKGNTRPSYEIPEEIKQNMSQAQMQAYEGLPEAQKQQYISNLQRSANFGLSAMSDRKAGLSGLSALVQNQNDAYNNLLSQDSAAHQANLANLMNVRSQMAGYKDQEFQMNKLVPFQETAQASQGLQGAGLQNIYGGLESGVGTLQNAQLAKSLEDPNSVNPYRLLNYRKRGLTNYGRYKIRNFANQQVQQNQAVNGYGNLADYYDLPDNGQVG